MIGARGRQVRGGVSKRATANARQARAGYALTDRELQIARRLCRMDEPTIRQAAEDLGITEQGVNDHVTRIYRKLGVATRLGMYRVLVEQLDTRME